MAIEKRVPHRYCGRVFSEAEMEWIRARCVSKPRLNRAQLSREVCAKVGWLRDDGRLKEMSCRVAMLKMHRAGHISLPAPLTRNSNGRHRPTPTRASDPKPVVTLGAGAFGELEYRLVTPRDSALWNELIERYHYLKYKPLPGAQLRYLVYAQGRLLAALGFGASAWKVAPRDAWIGWDDEQRKQNLRLIVNNARFLILPWVHSQNLASRLLGMASRRLRHDWQQRYGYQPVLLETFVERDRFRGTCYRASNWVHVGETQGRGKLDRFHEKSLPPKHIFLLPLHRHFRRELCADNALVPEK